MKQGGCLPESLPWITNHFLIPSYPGIYDWKWIKRQQYFIFLTKTNEPGSNWKMFPNFTWVPRKCITSNRCYNINARYCHQYHKYKVRWMVMRLKQGNGGQRQTMGANIRHMALLGQKVLFPQLKPHAQPWPATSQTHQVEKAAKWIRGHGTERNSKFILYQLCANSLLFVQKLNLWKSICGGYSPVTLLKVVNQTHRILGHKENLNVIRALHFTYEEIKDRRRKKRKLT